MELKVFNSVLVLKKKHRPSKNKSWKSGFNFFQKNVKAWLNIVDILFYDVSATLVVLY